jgi:hypothetical protein
MTSRKSAVTLALALAIPALHSTPSFSQTTEKAASKVKLVTLDLAVPDSPAFAILGLSPESVVRPNSPRDLATTVLNGIDRRGNLQSGFAVDFAPRFLFGGNSLTLAAYQKSAATRLAARTQISLATTKGASESDKSVRAAFGVRATIWDTGDPRTDDELVTCIDTIITQPPSTFLKTQAARDAYEKEQTAARKPKVEACHAAYATRNWNASSLAVGLAPSFQSPTGESGDFKYAGAGVWTSFALRLSGPAAQGETHGRAIGQLILQGRYRNKEQVPSKTVKGTFFEQDSGGLGARLLLGIPERALVVETELLRKSPKGADDVTTFSLSGGGQLKLATGVWLSVAVGGTRSGNTSDENHGAFVLSSFKWGFSREPAVKFP